jgi:hypothetical protein
LQNDLSLRENMERKNLVDFEEHYSAEKFYQAIVKNYEHAFSLCQ